MTTIAIDIEKSKIAKREYDISRRPIYKERKAKLRKSWKATERAATKKRKLNPSTWASVLLSNARFRAKKKGIPFSINKDDIIIPEVCPVLGIKLAMGTGNSFTARDCAPSLDRINNLLGYIPGNVMVVSWRANRIKTDATIQEIRSVLLYMERGSKLLP